MVKKIDIFSNTAWRNYLLLSPSDQDFINSIIDLIQMAGMKSVMEIKSDLHFHGLKRERIGQYSFSFGSVERVILNIFKNENIIIRKISISHNYNLEKGEN